MLIIFDLDDTLVKTSESIIPPKLTQVVDSKEHLSKLIRMDRMSGSSGHALDEYSEIHEHDVEKIKHHLKEGGLNDIDVETTQSVNECLAALSHEHRLCLVSRGDEVGQRAKLRKGNIDIDRFSELIFCSGQKLDAYLKLSQKYAEGPEEVLVCGDRVALDLTPAKQLGFHTVHMLHGRGKNSLDYFSDVDVKIIQLVDLFDIIDTIKRKNYLRRL